jgi:lipopolysaccharide/colanic/teichoic acid biosynthesis glycosyltransferase
MRTQVPASRVNLQFSLSLADVIVAVITPLAALYLRDAYILSSNNTTLIFSYWAISLICSLISFCIFRINLGIPRYYSARDLINVMKAVLVGEFMTCAFLFSITRLEGIPRSTPAVHALLLGAGLVIVRGLSHIGDKRRNVPGQSPSGGPEHVILIGLNDWSVLYLKFIDMVASDRQRVIALLDTEARKIGRFVNEVRVFGPPEDLESLVGEFAQHGVRVDRVLIGCGSDTLSDRALEQIRAACAKLNLSFAVLPSLFDHEHRAPAIHRTAPTPQWASAWHRPAGWMLPRYFQFKPAFDVFAAIFLSIVLSPVWMAVALLAFADVGIPIFFWQQRLGMHGRRFLLYKVRTLRSSTDWTRELTSDEERISGIGRFLRKTRLDEFPQLLNVILGEMSLVGPRPLLPCDQPDESAGRLMVLPGITGWAQVHGGTHLSAAEKKELDEFYVCNASLWLDLCIIAKSVRSLVRGDRISDAVVGVRVLRSSRREKYSHKDRRSMELIAQHSSRVQAAQVRQNSTL